MNKAPEKKEIFNKKEVGKVGTHAIASNQYYGYNQAIDDMHKWIDEAPIWETIIDYMGDKAPHGLSQAIRNLIKGKNGLEG